MSKEEELAATERVEQLERLRAAADAKTQLIHAKFDALLYSFNAGMSKVLAEAEEYHRQLGDEMSKLGVSLGDPKNN